MPAGAAAVGNVPGVTVTGMTVDLEPLSIMGCCRGLAAATSACVTLTVACGATCTGIGSDFEPANILTAFGSGNAAGTGFDAAVGSHCGAAVDPGNTPEL
ncbi:MAG: hypothetical protein JNK76_10080 [Planctomycetales bacterium]|nr:hypothetical protein [Planctomycetales bacterium]